MTPQSQDSPTGRYIVTVVGGEEVRAFVPAPLPPNPPLGMDGPLVMALDKASRSLGRFDGAVRRLPDPALLIYSYVRKEAVLSSQIEGTQSSLTDLMRHELGAAPGVPLDDVLEVSRYVAALDHALARMADPAGLPLCNRLLREAHRILLTGARGGDKRPGEFRTSQNWIGGRRPGTAVFVPPPALEAHEAISELEKFLHVNDDHLPPLVRAGLAHVQFETIHPFLDGNGRIGRMLITLMLMARGVLATPALYLSLYFKQHRSRYYDLLGRVRTEGDWTAWLLFFLEGIHATAVAALSTSERLEDLVERDRATIRARAGRATGSALLVHGALARTPILNVREGMKRTDLSKPAVQDALRRLGEFRIAREVTGQRRNRLFAYTEYLDILSEGTEPL